LICEIQVKNGLDLSENYRNINGCKTFAASIAQTLVDKQVKNMPTINKTYLILS
jgi:cytochrome c1